MNKNNNNNKNKNNIYAKPVFRSACVLSDRTQMELQE